ncbi:hypothetical protein KUK90_004440 [Vibrio parahaemolyticus]|nr:hypothetical protein [Vibrio parahaemolyticus]
MKPLGTNNAAENELTTPEKTPFQRVNRLLNQQTQRAEFQQKSSTQLTKKSPHKSTVETMPILDFHHAN